MFLSPQLVEGVALYAAGIATLAFVAVLVLDVRMGKTKAAANRNFKFITGDLQTSDVNFQWIREKMTGFESTDDSQTKRLNDQMSHIVSLEKKVKVAEEKLERDYAQTVLIGASLQDLYKTLLGNGTFRVVERSAKVKKIRATAPARRRRA